MGSTSGLRHGSLVITLELRPAGRQIECQGEPMGNSLTFVINRTHVFGLYMSCFVQKNMTMHIIFLCRTATSKVVESTQPLYEPADGGTTVLPVYSLFDICVELVIYVEATDYRSNFAKTIIFENCSCFSKIPFSISVESPWIFQCLISIPAGH